MREYPGLNIDDIRNMDNRTYSLLLTIINARQKKAELDSKKNSGGQNKVSLLPEGLFAGAQNTNGNQ